MTSVPSIHIGIALPHKIVYGWQHQLIKKLNENMQIDIKFILKKTEKPSSKILKRRSNSELLNERGEFSDGSFRCINFQDLEKENNLDLILNLTKEKISVDKAIAKWGIWQFDQEEFYDPFALKFWIKHHFLKNKFKEIRILSYFDGENPKVIYRGQVKKIKPSYFQTLENALIHAIEFPLRGIKKANISNEKFPELKEFQTSLKLNPMHLIWSICSMFKSHLSDLIRSEFFEEVWSVGVIDRPISDLLKGPPDKIKWYKDVEFAADPFGIETKRGIKIFAEGFKDKGFIGSFEYSKDNGFSSFKKELEKDGHLSYPFIFSNNGTNFCLPENSEEGIAKLFKINNSGKLELVSKILPGKKILDGTIINHNNRWWLFCSLADFGPQENLFIFHSENLESGWEEHSLNPVKTDIRSSRPAGTIFTFNGEFYRPSQDCRDTYGGALTISRIVNLTPDSFEEIFVTSHHPNKQGPNPHGLHTISSVRDFTLIDGKRFVFRPRKAIRYVFGKIKGHQDKEIEDKQILISNP